MECLDTHCSNLGQSFPAQPRVVQRSIFAATLVAVLVMYGFTVAYVSNQSSAASALRSKNYATFDFPAPPNATNVGNPVIVQIKWTQVNMQIAGSTLVASIRFIYPPSMLVGQAPKKATKGVRFSFDSGQVSIAQIADAQVSDKTITIEADEGTILDYPLDAYSITLNAFATESVSQRPLQLQLQIDLADCGAFATTSTQISTQTFPGSQIVIPAFSTVFARPKLQIVFPVFVAVAMAILAIVLTLLIWLFPLASWRKNDNPALLAFSSSLIFALPSLRNASSPAPIGATLDFYGFFWAELSSVVVLVSLIVNYYSDARPAPPAPGK